MSNLINTTMAAPCSLATSGGIGASWRDGREFGRTSVDFAPMHRLIDVVPAPQASYTKQASPPRGEPR